MRSYRQSLITLATGLVFASTFAACASHGSAGSSGGSGSYPAGDPNLVASNPGGGALDPFLSDGKAVLQALDAIAAKSGTPLRVTSMDADRLNGLEVNVQEPKNHINVDHYLIAPDGTLTGPTPVKVMSLDGKQVTAATVDAQAFNPRSLGWAHLTDTVRSAIARSHYADARATNWELDGIESGDKRFIYFESARARPIATVDAALKIINMQY